MFSTKKPWLIQIELNVIDIQDVLLINLSYILSLTGETLDGGDTYICNRRGLGALEIFHFHKSLFSL